MIEAFNNTDKTYDEESMVGNVEYEVKEEIKDKANKKSIDIKASEEKTDKQNVIDVEPEKVEENKSNSQNRLK
ncbi:hypothetical protein [Clostridium kluyveri]|uniref:hypothetical protein n=1 Tax=Clostridium kluyveri TaxID=1534 RepID=UPI001FA8810C|nr:hypothetical protein [Clostridium kluyveri]